eukprot:1368615-Rhodomonas_salina.1
MSHEPSAYAAAGTCEVTRASHEALAHGPPEAWPCALALLLALGFERGGHGLEHARAVRLRQPAAGSAPRRAHPPLSVYGGTAHRIASA